MASSHYQIELPAETLQQQFAKKFSHLLSAPPQSVGPQNTYWQYSHGFDSPLPTGGHCSTAADVPVKTLTFPPTPSPTPPESPKPVKPKKTAPAGNKKSIKAKKAGKKSNNNKAKPKGGVKKKPTKKAQALTKLLKLFT